ncbi:hypothetical protein K402DRAFT_77196 [Aulographum hederae CBS 113979]|uniref:Uncharacterized protein n=1 Tax=Aulographum hederae CBS 113979 TaxID=1176131 RepID=A0A6G1HGE4_9PEZI|nr:hypothetical protein K402DRAFT_77196 [Aulographum hederae CBS 113979]
MSCWLSHRRPTGDQHSATPSTGPGLRCTSRGTVHSLIIAGRGGRTSLELLWQSTARPVKIVDAATGLGPCLSPKLANERGQKPTICTVPPPIPLLSTWRGSNGALTRLRQATPLGQRAWNWWRGRRRGGGGCGHAHVLRGLTSHLSTHQSAKGSRHSTDAPATKGV